MQWWDMKGAYGDLLRELQDPTLPDRMVGLLAAAYLDDALKSKLKDSLRDDPNIQGKMFGDGGPLSEYGARNNYAYLAGLYGPKVHADLTDIGWIRNQFAHVPAVVTFGSDAIRVRCQRLRVFDRYATEYPNGEKWLYGGKTIWDAMITGGPHPIPTDPRERFLAAAQLLSGMIALLTMSRPEPKEDF